MKKTKRILMTVTLLIAAVFLLNAANLPAGNVQAASKVHTVPFCRRAKGMIIAKCKDSAKHYRKTQMKSVPES